MRQKTVNTKLLGSVTESCYKVRQVLQSVTDCYYKVRQVLQSATAITKWDVTLKTGVPREKIKKQGWKSPNLYETVNVITNFLGQPLSLNVISGTAWTTKGIDCFNPTTIDATIPLHKFLFSSTPAFSPDWYYHQNTVTRKGAFFIKCF